MPDASRIEDPATPAASHQTHDGSSGASDAAATDRGGPRPNLASYLHTLAGDQSNTAYLFPDGLRTHRMSYAELVSLAWRCGNWMISQGLKPGDRVLLWGANRGEWAAVFWGCLASGIVAVPVDFQSSVAYLARVAAETQAALLWLDDAQQAQLRQDLTASLPAQHAFSDLRKLVSAAPAMAPAADMITRDSLAQIIFTSGSTASPKGVCLTHGNTLASLEPIEREMRRYLRYERPFHPLRFLVQLPLSHVFGQMLGMFLPPLLRAEVHFLPELSPADVVSTIRERRISVLATVPRYLEVLGAEVERGSRKLWGDEGFERRLQQAGKAHFLKSWWLFRDVHARMGWKFWAFVCGGASLPEDLEGLWRRLGYAVIQGYGMTETASLISVNHPFKMSRGSIGKSMAGREIRISETGEILVRGQTLSPGYWSKDGKPVPLSSDDQWFATGDLAERDAQGNFYFRGRSKEVIVAANGMNIYPEDLEQSLRAEAEIRDAVVVAVEEDSGPIPMAILLAAGAEHGIEAAVRRVNGKLETHQRMPRWALWPEPDFPRTSTRKVRRGQVREFAQALVSGEPVESLRASALEQLLAEAGARWQGDLRDDWQLGADLAVDSLARVQLLSALEARFSVSLDEATVSDQTTIAALRSALEAALGRDEMPPTVGAVGTESSTAASIQQEAQASAQERSTSPETAAAGGPSPLAAAVVPKSAKPGTPPFPFPRWPRTWWASAFRQIFSLLVLRPLTRFYSARARVNGVEHLRTLQQPALFVCNHLTEIDGALLAGRFPFRITRRMAIAMSGEMLRGYKYPAAEESWYWKLWLPIQYVLVVLCYHVFPLPRGSGVRRAFQHAGRLADEGHHLLVFPEGRRSTTGELLPFQQGAGILARDLRLPVVPVWLEGIHELREAGRSVARRGEVKIHVGAPLRFHPSDDPAQIVKQLEDAVATLSRKARQA